MTVVSPRCSVTVASPRGFPVLPLAGVEAEALLVSLTDHRSAS